MKRYVALLRGIAPSGTNMTNDKLRGVFEDLGFANVGSVLASGNITFQAPDEDVAALEQRIEDALAIGLGIASRTIIRDDGELRALVDSQPFAALTHSRETYLTATFLKHGAAAPINLPEAAGPHPWVVSYDPVARAILAVTDNRTAGGGSGFMAWLETSCGKDVTTRSWLTVQRVLRKLEN
jgi:uncharacterized protein (DUF1697 family)